MNQYDTSRYVSSADARDNRNVQFVREFASVVSILQVPFVINMILEQPANVFGH